MNAHPPLVVTPSPIPLSSFCDARREPTRPIAHRGEKFDAEFDFDTLFFDAFWVSPQEVVLLAPPFFNLEPALRRTIFLANGKPAKTEVRRFERHARVTVRAPEAIGTLEGRGPLGTFKIAVQANLATLFAGRRTLLTLSKDNPIPWILDWVRFHRDVHGADAVLFYDNGSTAYDARTLADALGSLEGVAQSVVVEWPFKYGPQGVDAKRYWDSDFCQRGAWEHARWRFLTEARSALVGDIDELVLSSNGASVFETAEQSRSGLARYHGRWVVGVEGAPPKTSEGSESRHRDFGITLRENMVRSRWLLRRDAHRCLPKWTVVPSRCPARAQWKVHSISHWPASLLTTPSLSFRHFRELTNNWKYARSSRDVLDPARHEIDAPLRSAMEKVDWNR